MSFLREFNEIYLNLTYLCNLDCPFCSTKAGGFFNKKGDMSEETARSCVDILLANSVTNTPNLTFFGGEPLLRFDTLRKTVEYGRSEESRYGKTIRFVIITNGVLLNSDILDFTKQNRIDLQINLDGPLNVHDELRRYPNGIGTYHKIMENIRTAQDKGIFISIRSHVPPNRIHFHDTMKIINTLNPTLTRIGFALVMGLSNDSEFLWKREDFEKNEKTFVDFVRRYKNNILELKRPDVDFFGLLGYSQAPETNREHFCEAGRVRFSTAPDGNISPCFTMEAQPLFNVGHIDKGLDIFRMTNYLTLSGEKAMKVEDGTKPGELFRFICPYQAWATSGKTNIITTILKESYTGFSILVQKMLSELRRPAGRKKRAKEGCR